MLAFKDKWLWDFWLAQDGTDTHIFYLQADRSLVDERLRHWNVSVGHAVSQDLRNWEVLPDALAPSDPTPVQGIEPFDSKTTWTGSIIQHAGTWYMFYTGSRESEKGLIQRVGLATSDDLVTWKKHSPEPLIEADPQWYETLDLDLWHDQAWRDPWVFKGADGQFHALVTARTNSGPADARGVIGHAISDDLLHWTVRPPLTQPGDFGHLEVPQVVHIGERYYLLFSCTHSTTAQSRVKRLGYQQDGTHYLVAKSELGPYDYITDKFLMADASLYSGKIVTDAQGQLHYLAFNNFAADGSFIGTLSDPLLLHVESDGRLRVEMPSG